MDFVDINEKPLSYYSRFYQGNGICICEKTITCKKMWEGFRASFAIENGCLIIKNDSVYFGHAFDFPLAEKGGDIDGALSKIEDYCAENGKKLVFCCINAEEEAYLAKRYSHFSCFNDRNYRDYIYSIEDMCCFAGKKYAGQRNHINKFLTLYPQANFRLFSNDDKEKIRSFFAVRKKTILPNKSNAAKNEEKKAERIILQSDFNEYIIGGVELNGNIIAVAFGEIARSTLVIHAEKALHEYEGVNVFMVREYAKASKEYAKKYNLAMPEYVNREDDSGEEGLRISKMQYHPLHIFPEYRMSVLNELSILKRIPSIKTDRLVLGPIRDADKGEYYRLCVDDELNKYWGYDYRKDLNGNLYTEYFYNVAKEDFHKRMALNFAVRLREKFIGEVVIFEFNYRGECKVGIRIFPEYAGNGYGTEAFEAGIKFALYNLGIKKVLSSCYKENISSVKMHTRLMHKTSEDGEKYYYEREY